MRIGIDARTMVSARPRGTGRNLLDAYRIIPRLRPDWEFVLYHQRPLPQDADIDDPPWRFPNVRLRQIDMPGDRLDAWFQLRLPLAAREDRLTVLHCPANAAPRWSPVRLVVTIHDLAPLEVTGEMPPSATVAFRRNVERALRNASEIICPSAATRDAVCARFRTSPDSFHVIPWAPDTGLAQPSRRSAGEVASALESLGLKTPFFIHFAGDTPRKNALGVIAALAGVPAPVNPPHVLFVGCAQDATQRQLLDAATREGVADRVVVAPYLALDVLRDVLRAASGLLIPSLCEGFGLPVLDAFAAGVPVIASRGSSLPEIAGDAALYCDPNNPQTIGDAMTQLLAPGTAEALAIRGRARANDFDWETTADAMCRVYARAVEPRHVPVTMGQEAAW